MKSLKLLLLVLASGLISAAVGQGDLAQRFEVELRKEQAREDAIALWFDPVFTRSGNLEDGAYTVQGESTFEGDSAIALKSNCTYNVYGSPFDYQPPDTVYDFSRSGYFQANYWAFSPGIFTIVMDIKFEKFGDKIGYTLFRALGEDENGINEHSEFLYVRDGWFYWDLGDSPNYEELVASGGGHRLPVLEKWQNEDQILKENKWYRIVITVQDKGDRKTEFKIYVNGEEIVNHVVTPKHLSPNAFTPKGRYFYDIGRPFLKDSHDKTTCSLRRFAVFDMEFEQPEVDQVQPWELMVDCDSCSGEFEIPEVFAILYDPPGDHSYCQLVIDSSTENITSFSSVDASSQTLPMGLYDVMHEKEGAIGDRIWQFGKFLFNGVLKGISVTNTSEYRSETSYSIKFSQTQEFNSKMETEFQNHIGQQNGTIFAIQEIKWKWIVGRRLINGLQESVPDDSNYEYKIFQRPLNLPSDLVCMSLPNLIEYYGGLNQQGFVDSLVKYLAVDTATGKIKSEYVNDGSLTKEGGEVLFAGTKLKVSRSDNRTSSFSYSWKASVSEGKRRKLGALGITLAEWGFSQTHTNTKSESQSASIERTATYVLDDDEPWDRISVQPYWDTRFGTWVFDVLDSTYTSIPYEIDYSKPSASWDIQCPDTTGICKLGDTLVFPITFLNTSIASDPLLDSLKVISEIQNNSALSKVLFMDKLEINRDVPLKTELRIVDSAIGSDTVTLTLYLLRPANSWDQVYVDEKTMTFFVQFTKTNREIQIYSDSTFAVVNKDTPMPVAKNFRVAVINNGDDLESVDIGVSDFSPGTKYQLSTLTDPIASGDTAYVTVMLTGLGSNYPFSVDFYAQISGVPASRETITFTVDTTLSSISARTPGNTRLALRPGEIRLHNLNRPGVITWEIGGSRAVEFSIFDCSGRRISSVSSRNGIASWNATGGGSGLHFIKWTYDGKTNTRPIYLIR